LRTTPALLGLFSLVTLLAHQPVHRGQLSIRQAAWYVKPKPTFSDALAVVRQHIWRHWCFQLSGARMESAKLSPVLRNRLIPALSYAP
jgi:hypothetical protein